MTILGKSEKGWSSGLTYADKYSRMEDMGEHAFKIGDKVRTAVFAGIITGLPSPSTGNKYKVELFPGQGWPTEYVFVDEPYLEKVA